MIIEKETFERLTEDEIKSLCSKFNKEVTGRFYIEENKFCISDVVKIPLQIFNYKQDILREYLMTKEELNSELKTGKGFGTFLNKTGQIIL